MSSLLVRSPCSFPSSRGLTSTHRQLWTGRLVCDHRRFLLLECAPFPCTGPDACLKRRTVWGRTMELRHQDREDPNSMFSSFLAGAAAGTACAILQTPVCFLLMYAAAVFDLNHRSRSSRSGRRSSERCVLPSFVVADRRSITRTGRWTC